MVLEVYMRKKVAVIFGGRSLESDISVITGLQAIGNVDKSRYIVEPIYMFEGDFYAQDVDTLAAFENFKPAEHKKLVLVKGEFCLVGKKQKGYFKPDAALICCHGGEGEDGTLQAILQFNRIPFSSADALASAVMMDKVISKMLFSSLGFNVIAYDEVSADELENGEATAVRLEQKIGYPMIVKPRSLGSSIGISAAHCRQELMYALKVATQFERRVVVEHLLEGAREVNCAAIMDRDRLIISRTEQPIASGSFLSFDDKYMSNAPQKSGMRHIVPADIGELVGKIEECTAKIYLRLALRGVVRVDYLIDGNDNIYVNEVNTVPGSLAFYLFEPMGIKFGELIDILIENCRVEDGNAYRFFKTQVLSSFRAGSKAIKTRQR